MKKELLLSTMILTSPVAYLNAETTTRLRSSILEQIEHGQTRTLKGEIGKSANGKKLYLKVTLETNKIDQQTPNLVKPEFSGQAEIVDEAGQRLWGSSPENDEAFIFDLIDQDEGYTSTYLAYSCSSTLQCRTENDMTLEFGKDYVFVQMKRPSFVVGQDEMVYVELK